MRHWPLVLLLLLVPGCGGEDFGNDTGLGSAGADSVVWGEDRARPGAAAQGSSLDRLFLERVLDHYQGLEHLAERMKRTSTVSAVRRDAWRFDRRQSAEREQVDGLLRELYGERYLPTVPEEFRSAAVAISALPAEQQAHALLEFVTGHQREDVARIDSILPSLEHPRVRELARELRRDQQRDLRVFARRLARE
jgi:hypothetical protein